MSDKNYRPEHPEYKIPEQYEAYPRELNFGGETLDEAVKLAMDRLIAEPTKESAQRCLDEKEIEIYRGEYTSLLENDKPAEQAALDELLAEDARLKEKIKAQREVIQSITQKVNDKSGLSRTARYTNRWRRTARCGSPLTATTCITPMPAVNSSSPKSARFRRTIRATCSRVRPRIRRCLSGCSGAISHLPTPSKR